MLGLHASFLDMALAFNLASRACVTEDHYKEPTIRAPRVMPVPKRIKLRATSGLPRATCSFAKW